MQQSKRKKKKVSVDRRRQLRNIRERNGRKVRVSADARVACDVRAIGRRVKPTASAKSSALVRGRVVINHPRARWKVDVRAFAKEREKKKGKLPLGSLVEKRSSLCRTEIESVENCHEKLIGSARFFVAAYSVDIKDWAFEKIFSIIWFHITLYIDLYSAITRYYVNVRRN